MNVLQAEKSVKKLFSELDKTEPGKDVIVHDIDFNKLYKNVEINPYRIMNIAMEQGLIPIKDVMQVTDFSKTYIILDVA